MNRLAIGTAQFGFDYGIKNDRGQVTRDEAGAILSCASANGIDTLDTAAAYGDGEQRLGEIGVDGWHIVSKLPPVPDACGDVGRWVDTTLRTSLRRLRVSSLYGLLLHRPAQLREARGAELYQALERIFDDGLVNKVGISIYDPSDLDLLEGRLRLELVQAPFNLLDRRLIETGWLTRFGERGIELHVRSVFLQGLLLMADAERPRKFDRWSALLSEFQRWVHESDLTPLQACLRYSLSFSSIDKVIVGVESVAQVEEIMGASTGPVPKVPPALHSRDLDLLNPARWAAL